MEGQWEGRFTAQPLASLCVPGDRAVWPAAQRSAETVSAALPVLQPPAPHPSALPLPHLGLLQQPAQQGRPAAGDELRAAGHLHSGKPGPTVPPLADSVSHSND